jgi:hypothetical protein
MKRASSALIILLVAACARSEEASLISSNASQGYNQVGAVGTPEADDREPAIGQWRASLQENVQVLEFGPLGTEPLFSILCTGNRTVLLQRHGGAPAGELPTMQFTKGQLTERLPVTAGAGAVPLLRSEVPLQSPLLQAIAAEGDPLQVRLGDGAPMVLPPSALIGDYLRTCETGRPSAPAATGNSAAPAGNTAAPAAVAPPAGGNVAAPVPAANAAQPQPQPQQ